MALFTDTNSGSIVQLFTLTSKNGMKIHTKGARKLTKITKGVNTPTLTKAYLSTVDYTILQGPIDFIGNDAIFDYDLEDNTDYLVLADAAGASHSLYYDSTYDNPETGTWIDWIAGDNGSGSEQPSRVYNIQSITTDSIVTETLRKIKVGGTFVDKPILTKVAGTFVDKPIKIKVGGTFQDA